MKTVGKFIRTMSGRKDDVSIAHYFEAIDFPATTEELIQHVGKKRVTIGDRRITVRSLLRELGDRSFSSPIEVDRLVNRSRGPLALVGALLKGRRPLWIVAGTAGLAMVAGAVKLLDAVRRRRIEDDEAELTEALRRASGTATVATDEILPDEGELGPAGGRSARAPGETSTTPVV